MKNVALGNKLSTQLPVVIDFPIEYQDIARSLIYHRLVALLRKVNDAQAIVCKSDAMFRIMMYSPIIGTSVSERGAQFLQLIPTKSVNLPE